MPEDYSKDTVIAILGASVALSGLLLVFAGLLFSQAAAFPKDTTDDDVIEKYRKAGRLAMWPFLFSLVISAGSLAWLLCPYTAMFTGVWISFGVLLFATAVYGFWVTWGLL
jgi:hypothetical protein